MKINKDQLQKAFLAGLLACGGLYYYGVEMLQPLSLREVGARKEIASLETKVKEAKSRIARTQAIAAGDVNAAAALHAYEVMRAKIPGGQPVAWFPTRLSETFRQQGIAKQSFRCNPEIGESEIPGYKFSSWSIELAETHFSALGAALARLENQEALVQINTLQINSGNKEPETHHAQLTISTIVKNEK